LYSSNLSKIGVIFNSFAICVPFIYTTTYSSNFETDIVSRPGLVNLWHRKYFLGMWHSRLCQLLFMSFVWPLPLYCQEYLYIYTCLTAQRLNMN
jgi:hypothetical protein